MGQIKLITEETGGVSMNEDSITSIYCDVDDFCKALDGYYRARLLPGGKTPKWFPASRLSLSEVVTVTLLFRLSGYRCFKWYYQRHVCIHMREYFPAPASYNRFVELMGRALLLWGSTKNGNCTAPLGIHVSLYLVRN
jgi:hypothetical protein